MKEFFQKYKHAWVFLYGLIYLPWFYYLERTVTHGYNVIQLPLDKKIPFIEFFIIPYYLWFAFIAVAVFYFFFTNTKEFYQLVTFLVIGMTLFLIICTLFPNGQMLRPTHFVRDNIFTDLVKHLYILDTPTNVFPSIHVYNSIGVMIAINSSEQLKSKKWAIHLTNILGCLIILSTMFLKQHSVLDVVGAGIFATIFYVFVYASEPKNTHVFSKSIS